MVAGRMKESYAREAKERQGTRTDLVAKVPPSDNGKARDKAGEAVGVSGKTVDQASKVLDKGAPELIKAVDEGTIAVSKAAKLAELPKKRHFPLRR